MTRSIPILIFTGLVLYTDRILRREVILDSSALSATIFVAHLLNICRSSIAHVDSAVSSDSLGNHHLQAIHEQMRMLAAASSATAAEQDLANNSTLGISELHQLPDTWSRARFSMLGSMQMHGSSLTLSWWQEGAVYVTYTMLSILLLANTDVVSMLLSPGASLGLSRAQHKGKAIARPHAKGTTAKTSGKNNGAPSFVQLACWHEDVFTSSQSSDARVSTVVTHCIMVGIVLQLGVERATFMAPGRVMARSFAFTGLSILWTYACGVLQRTASLLSNPAGRGNDVEIGGCDYYSYDHGDNSSGSEDDHDCDFQHDYFSLRHHNPIRNTRPSSLFDCYVEPFTPCQLRFAVLLFLDGWLMPVATVMMAVVMIRRLREIACMPLQPASFGSSSNPKTRGCDEGNEMHEVVVITATGSVGEEHRAGSRAPQRLHRDATKPTTETRDHGDGVLLTFEASAAAAGMHTRKRNHGAEKKGLTMNNHSHVSNNAQQLEASSSAIMLVGRNGQPIFVPELPNKQNNGSSSLAEHSRQSAADEGGPKEDLLAMFRMAQQQAALEAAKQQGVGGGMP